MFEHLPEWVNAAGEWMEAAMRGACGVLLFTFIVVMIILVIKLVREE